VGSDNSYRPFWRDLRSSETNLVLRVGASIAFGALLSGLAIVGGYAIAAGADFRLDPDETVGVGLLLATIPWFVSLWLIWRRLRRGRMLVRPLIGTLVIAILTSVGAFFIEEFVRRFEELLTIGLLLCSGTLVILIWLSTVQRLLRGKPVFGSDRQVDVHCPSCGYSLVGLTELRCPECGTRFTIDELIRAQYYARPGQDQGTNKLPDSGSLETGATLRS